MTAQLSAFEVVTQRLTEVTGFSPRNGSALWRCPAHDDRNPSLSVSSGDKGVTLHCFAGCEPTAIVRALGLKLTDLFDDPARSNGKTEILSAFDYVDESGERVYQVVRLSPKGFRQRRPDGKGGWIWDLQGVRRVIYRMPQVVKAIERGEDVICITEGEKDADAVVRAGVEATCNPMGAGKWRSEYTESLRGANKVVVIADNDLPGYRHARDVARSLKATGIDTDVVHALDGKDVSDHLAAGRDLDDLEKLTPAELDQLCAEPEEMNVDSRPAVSGELVIEDLRDVLTRVRNAPKRKWLFRESWAEGDYGMFSGPDKAGKSWAILDAVVSVASGTPWLGRFEVESPGPVLVFLGEGGEKKVVRRLEAIARARGIELDDLPIRICFRAPHLTNDAAMIVVEEELRLHRPRLVLVDPLYLAARGARGSDLYEMGANLERIQHLTQDVDSALMLSHHHKKTGDEKGALRMSGVGPGAWGRVLIAATVIGKKFTDPVTKASTVMLDLDFQGDEIADTTLRLRRKVWSDDPKDLDAELHYEIEVYEADSKAESAVDARTEGLTPAAKRVLDVLDGNGQNWLDVRGIGDRLAADTASFGPLKPRTIQNALSVLRERKLAESDGAGGSDGFRWRALAETRADSVELSDENDF